MDIFKLMKKNKQEQIAFYTDKSVNLRAILAVHSTALGPAIGGIRILKYITVEDAVFDLLRLSRAMTYKTAAAELNFGGGEIVIIDQDMKKEEALFRALGRFIESFKGRFIAAEDIGVIEESMEYMRMETKYVSGLPDYYGGSGNHSYMCAYGTLLGILAASRHCWGSDSISGKKIVIQGYGRIGKYLADLTKEKGADVIVSDINPDAAGEASKKGFKIIPADTVYKEKCDIFSPCATGAVINPETSSKLQCKIVAGSANNQLLNKTDDIELKKRGVLYTPDFIINAGGIIDVSEEYLGYKPEKAKRKTENIYERTLNIFKYADNNGLSNRQAAVQYALNRIEAVKNIRGTFLGKGKI